MNTAFQLDRCLTIFSQIVKENVLSILFKGEKICHIYEERSALKDVLASHWKHYQLYITLLYLAT